MLVEGPLLLVPAVAGLALGSYAATAGLRLAEGVPTSFGRSRCDGCGEGLGFVATTPILSYVALRGRCAHCRTAIHPAHPIGEALGAAGAATSFALLSPVVASLVFAVGMSLLAASVTDLRVQRLPNGLTLAIAVLGAALAWLRGPAAMVEGVASAAIVFAGLWALRAVMTRARGDSGLGFGDVKLLAALALWLGATISLAVAGAALIGLACAPFLRDGRGRLPFGPMIAAAGWAVGLAVQTGWTPWPI